MPSCRQKGCPILHQFFYQPWLDLKGFISMQLLPVIYCLCHWFFKSCYRVGLCPSVAWATTKKKWCIERYKRVLGSDKFQTDTCYQLNTCSVRADHICAISRLPWCFACRGHSCLNVNSVSLKVHLLAASTPRMPAELLPHRFAPSPFLSSQRLQHQLLINAFM